MSLLQKARERGEISFPRECVLFFETANPGEVIVNTSRIAELDPTDPFDVSEAERIGREQAREIMDFVHRYMPGFENAKLAFTGPEIGRRSSRQLKGAYTLQVQDSLGAAKFPDAVVCNAYPVDIHSPHRGPQRQSARALESRGILHHPLPGAVHAGSEKSSGCRTGNFQ